MRPNPYTENRPALGLTGHTCLLREFLPGANALLPLSPPSTYVCSTLFLWPIFLPPPPLRTHLFGGISFIFLVFTSFFSATLAYPPLILGANSGTIGNLPGADVHELPDILAGCGVPYVHVLPQSAHEVRGARVVLRGGGHEELLIPHTGFAVSIACVFAFSGGGGMGKRVNDSAQG